MVGGFVTNYKVYVYCCCYILFLLSHYQRWGEAYRVILGDEYMQSQDKNRLIYIDIVKAIAMISIVVFHSCTNNASTYLATNAYLIRVTSAYGLPVFFFVNGFLFHNKDMEHPAKMIWKKIKSYYFPFLCYNLSFWVLLIKCQI